MLEFSWIKETFCKVASIFDGALSSPITTALIGPAVAALAGAYAAIYFARNQKRRDDNLRELHIANASINISFEFCNSAIGLKEGSTGKVIKRYITDCKKYEEAKKSSTATLARFLSDFVPTFGLIPELYIPVDILSKQIYEQIGCNSRTHFMLGILLRSGETLNSRIRQYNGIVEAYRMNERMSKEEREILLAQYFGYRSEGGREDKTFESTLKVIETQLDNCIYCSSELCAEISDLAEDKANKIGRKSPKFNRMQFDIAKEKGLMPDPKLFSEWEKGFRKNE